MKAVWLTDLERLVCLTLQACLVDDFWIVAIVKVDSIVFQQIKILAQNVNLLVSI